MQLNNRAITIQKGEARGVYLNRDDLLRDLYKAIAHDDGSRPARDVLLELARVLELATQPQQA